MQLELFDTVDVGTIELEDIFSAYYECRKNKRRTINALAFEADFEENLIRLWRDINDRSYMPGRSIAFIVSEPVQREVFAADFRDRIVHHLIINKLNHLFEAQFINDSYSCREGKGTQYGVNRIAEFIRLCSENYTKDCYILKMDIQSFFMSINKAILFRKLREFVLENYHESDRLLLIELIYKVIFNNPQDNCYIKGRRSDWKGLPKSKSLFTVAKGKGLPIGNLTSQIFANFYLNFFDKFVVETCGVKYYGRYVDDFVIVHEDKAFLLGLKDRLKEFIQRELAMTLHPKKVYLQHYTKGVKFIGAVIKPNCEYIGNRTKGNLYARIRGYNEELFRQPKQAPKMLEQVAASINSYLGFMIHYKTFKIRRRLLTEVLAPGWRKYLEIAPDMSKVTIKPAYKPVAKAVNKLKNKKKRRKKFMRPLRAVDSLMGG
ncbi:MAG: RNA-directed DNA polymerase [Alphaproteobacteria bacterium]